MLRPGKKSSKMNMAGITGSTELRPAPLIQTQVRIGVKNWAYSRDQKNSLLIFNWFSQYGKTLLSMVKLARQW